MPETAAGRAPVTDQGRWLIDHQGLVNISKPAHHSMRGDEIDLAASVATIEREARALGRAEALDRLARAYTDGYRDGLANEVDDWNATEEALVQKGREYAAIDNLETPCENTICTLPRGHEGVHR